MDKNRALDQALAQIERAFGKGSVMRMGARDAAEAIETIPTGSLGLDLALGIGGLPRGRIIEIYGPRARAKRRLPCTASPKRRSAAALAPSSTPNTRSIRSMPASLGSMSTT